MERSKKVVLKAPDGMHYITSQGKDGELILELVPNVTTETSVVTSNKDKYFIKITEQDREKVKKWLKEQKNETQEIQHFLERVNEAIQKIDYDYWIATIAPCVEHGAIYYAEGKKIGVGYYCNHWKTMAEEYLPERGSRLANLYELFIWYALRIVDGFWTLNHVTTNHHVYYFGASILQKKIIEKSRKEITVSTEYEGYRDGVTGTYKIVTLEKGYVTVGCDCYGYRFFDDRCAVTVFHYYDFPAGIRNSATAVLVLTK